MEQEDLFAIIALQMAVAGRSLTMGFLLLGRKAGEKFYTREDVEFLRAISSLVAQAWYCRQILGSGTAPAGFGLALVFSTGDGHRELLDRKEFASLAELQSSEFRHFYQDGRGSGIEIVYLDPQGRLHQVS